MKVTWNINNITRSVTLEICVAITLLYELCM
jgi:hypothetical protein